MERRGEAGQREGGGTVIWFSLKLVSFRALMDVCVSVRMCVLFMDSVHFVRLNDRK